MNILASNMRLAMEKVLKSRVDQSFTTLLGFDIESFFHVREKIAPLVDKSFTSS